MGGGGENWTKRMGSPSTCSTMVIYWFMGCRNKRLVIRSFSNAFMASQALVGTTLQLTGSCSECRYCAHADSSQEGGAGAGISKPSEGWRTPLESGCSLPSLMYCCSCCGREGKIFEPLSQFPPFL